MSLLDSENLKLAGVAGVFAWYSGIELPEWWILGASALVVGGIGALFASGKIDDLLPDPRSVRLVQVNGNGEPLAAWKMSPDKFAQMDVKWGPLYPHEESPYDAYECYVYDPERNVAVGTWRRSIPGSQIVGQHDVDDVLSLLNDYRGRLEPEARRATELRTAIPGILRDLEYHRAELQSSALDPNSPIKTDTPSIDDVIGDHLPDELQPGHIRNGDLSTLLEAGVDNDPGDGFNSEAFEIVVDVDQEAIDVSNVATDGGETDDE